MPSVLLEDRALVLVAGPDAEHFLQNIITTDLDALPVGEARPGALLTPQGKILFDFLVSRDGVERFRLDCRRDVVADFVKRLTLYKLRAKVEISVDDQGAIAVSWGSDSATSQIDSSAVRDTRFATELGVMRYCGGARAADDADWTAFRVAHGVAESGSDYELGDAFPHDVLLDQMDGIGFKKGCYVGQEVVSRMQHRGTARRRVLILSGNAPLPEPGTEIIAAGKPVGTLGSVAGNKALAIVRIDRVKAALDTREPILADGVAVSPAIPGWARFTYPTEQAEEA